MTPAEARDRSWLEAVFSAHSGAVLAYARRRVPADEADDVVAEVFAAAWQHRARVPEPALPWLYRTASHQVLHAHRRRGRVERLVTRLGAQPRQHVGDHADLVASSLDDSRRVGAALAGLTPRDKEVLLLATWEDLSGDELAYVLGCSRTAANVRLHRARRRFSAALATQHPGSPLLPSEVST